LENQPIVAQTSNPLNNNSNIIIAKCNESWAQVDTTCIINSSIIEYTDINKCNTTENMPVDNGTAIPCDANFNYNLSYLIGSLIAGFIFITVILVWILV
jgi:hypothetical protein